ncbi:hypothetical protein AMTRI_Chr10g232590 [Amborella trichopoda]
MGNTGYCHLKATLSTCHRKYDNGLHLYYRYAVFFIAANDNVTRTSYFADCFRDALVTVVGPYCWLTSMKTSSVLALNQIRILASYTIFIFLFSLWGFSIEIVLANVRLTNRVFTGSS